MHIDLETPSVWISRTVYEAFFMKERHEDRDAAMGFMSNVRMYVNFNRNVIKGMLENVEDSERAATSEKWGTLDDKEWLTLVIAEDDSSEVVYKAGRYRDDVMDLWVVDEEKHPLEAVRERMERLQMQVKNASGKSREE